MPKENELLNYIDSINEEIQENDIFIVEDFWEKDIASIITPIVLTTEDYEVSKDKINQLGLNVLIFNHSSLRLYKPKKIR